MHRRPTDHAGRVTTTDPRRRGLRALVAALALITAMVAMALPTGAGADVTTTTTDATTGTVDTTTSTTSTTGTTLPAAEATTTTTEAPTDAVSPDTTAPTTEATATTDTTAPDARSAQGAVAVPAAASITVTPSTLLVAGDVVTVAGSGFPANSLIGIIECKVPSSSVADCNQSTLRYANSDAGGNFSTSFIPRRILIVAGSPIDCSGLGACQIGAGDVYDQTITDNFPIRFDPSIPPPPPPTLSVTPSTNLLDRQTVTVTGSGYPADTSVVLLECLDPPTADPFNCGYSSVHNVLSDGSGAISTTITVRRIVRTQGTSTDCATAGACVLLSGVNEVGDGATAPIQFDGSVPPPPPPTISVTPSTNLLDGDTVHVTGTDFDPNFPVSVAQCPAGVGQSPGCGYGPGSFVVTDDAGAFSLDLVVDRILYGTATPIDCAVPGACVVSAIDLYDGSLTTSVAIQFDPNAPLPPPPSVRIDPATGVDDGQFIRVFGSGFPRHTNVGVIQCRVNAGGAGGCDMSTLTYAFPDDSGDFTATLRAKRFITTDTGVVDCAVEGACVVGAGVPPDGHPSANTPILFRTAVPGPDVSGSDQTLVTPNFTG